MTLPVAVSPTIERLLVAALLLVIALGLQAAADLVAIFVVSLVLTLLALPVVNVLRRRGVPDSIAVAAVSIIAFLLLVGLVGLFAYAFQILVTDLGSFQDEFDQRVAALLLISQEFGLDAGMIPPSSIDLTAFSGVALGSISNLGGMLMNIFFGVIAIFFMLLEAPHLPGRVARILGAGSPALAQASRMSGIMIDFMVARTETNLVHGVAFGGILLAMGVYAAALWGVLTFLLGYVRYLGPIVAAPPAVFFAWLQFGLPGALAVVAVTVVLNLIIESPVFSFFASRAFEVPFVLVVLAVVVFGWLFGVLGMLFAVPLMLTVLILVHASEETRWITVLLGVDRFFESGADRH